jgi:hypothetical protein
MKPKWTTKILVCGLLSSISLLLLHQSVDDSLLICARGNDRQVNCMVSQINLLGQQHDGQEVIHVKKASLDILHQPNGKMNNASRVLLVTDQGQIAVGADYASRSQPESAAVVTQVNQFLQSQESRLEVSIAYSPRFFFLFPIVILGLCPLLCLWWR